MATGNRFLGGATYSQHALFFVKIKITNANGGTAMNDIVHVIIRSRRLARKLVNNLKVIAAERRMAQVSLERMAGDRFGAHRRKLLKARIEALDAFAADQRQNLRKVRETLAKAVLIYDRYLNAGDVGELASILGIHHVHVERALKTGCAARLFDLAMEHVEAARESQGMLSARADTPIFSACSVYMAHVILADRDMAKQVVGEIQKFAQETLGRPLRRFETVVNGDGKVLLKSGKPLLHVVQQD